MLMIILTLSVKSILVFKFKRAAIVTWSPSLAARINALSRFNSSTEWINRVWEASSRFWRYVRWIVDRMWFSALVRLHERSHITHNFHRHDIQSSKESLQGSVVIDLQANVISNSAKCWISHHFNSGPLHEHGCHRTAEKNSSASDDVIIAPISSLSPLMRQATDWRTLALPTQSSWCQWMREGLVWWHFRGRR